MCASLLLGCAGCASPSARVEASASAPRAEESATASPRAALPIIELRGAEIAVDGASVMTIEPAAALVGPRRLDPVHDALRARRLEAGAAFAGVVGIRATSDATFDALGSAWFSAASAGYARVALQRIGDGEVIDVDVDLDLHSSPTELHLELAAGEDVRIAWRPRLPAGAGGPARARAPRRELGAEICRQWETRGAHREPDDPARDRAVVHADVGVPFRELWEVLDAVASCRRDHHAGPATPLSSGLEEIPAFRLYLSLKRLPLRALAPASP